MHACRHGYVEIVRMLPEAGVDVNARDEDGWTALMGDCVSSAVHAINLRHARGRRDFRRLIFRRVC